MNRFTESETNTFDEVTKALNILVDRENENEAYNAKVDEYNKSLSEEKGAK